ncbi:MAG: 50S ribosomal protein L31 [Candidatus Bathyarchaeota archaeon]|nr:50S ribosomal protein L31 [Candidatus Bathyarchaeota archaeon]
MKKKIHPSYFKDSVQRCACGAVFRIPSTKKEVEIEICSQCHPFYTGKAKIVDAAGQVEKFEKRVTKTEKIKGGAKKVRRIQAKKTTKRKKKNK